MQKIAVRVVRYFLAIFEWHIGGVQTNQHADWQDLPPPRSSLKYKFSAGTLYSTKYGIVYGIYIRCINIQSNIQISVL